METMRMMRLAQEHLIGLASASGRVGIPTRIILVPTDFREETILECSQQTRTPWRSGYFTQTIPPIRTDIFWAPGTEAHRNADYAND